MPARVVPWQSPDEWTAVYSWLYAEPPNAALSRLGVKRVKAWMARGKIPHAVEATGTFTEVLLRDLSTGGAGLSSGSGESYAQVAGPTPAAEATALVSPVTQAAQAPSHGPHNAPTLAPACSELEIRLMYTMAMIRFVNGLTDAHQVGLRARSVAHIAAELGLPLWFVDIRHTGTHGRIPGLALLRSGAQQALQWLKTNYWDVELAGMQSVGAPAPPSASCADLLRALSLKPAADLPALTDALVRVIKQNSTGALVAALVDPELGLLIGPYSEPTPAPAALPPPPTKSRKPKRKGRPDESPAKSVSLAQPQWSASTPPPGNALDRWAPVLCGAQDLVPGILADVVRALATHLRDYSRTEQAPRPGLSRSQTCWALASWIKCLLAPRFGSRTGTDSATALPSASSTNAILRQLLCDGSAYARNVIKDLEDHGALGDCRPRLQAMAPLTREVWASRSAPKLPPSAGTEAEVPGGLDSDPMWDDTEQQCAQECDELAARLAAATAASRVKPVSSAGPWALVVGLALGPIGATDVAVLNLPLCYDDPDWAASQGLDLVPMDEDAGVEGADWGQPPDEPLEEELPVSPEAEVTMVLL